MKAYGVVHWMRSRSAALVSCALIAMSLSGCAGLGAPATPEEQVMQRAQARWSAMIKGDFPTAYGYFTPSYRGLFSLDRFKAGLGRGGWKTAEARRAACQVDKCTVTLKIELDLPLGRQGGTIPSYIEETWVLEGQQWWLYQSL